MGMKEIMKMAEKNPNQFRQDIGALLMKSDALRTRVWIAGAGKMIRNLGTLVKEMK